MRTAAAIAATGVLGITAAASGQVGSAEFMVIEELQLPGTLFFSNFLSGDGTVVLARVFGFFEGVPIFVLARWSESSGVEVLADEVSTESFAVNGSGDVIVGRGVFDGAALPFRWEASSGVVGLGDVPGSTGTSEARDVSRDGDVVVGSADTVDSNNEGFYWTAATGLAPIGDLPGGDVNSLVSSVSPDGTVLGGCGTTDDAIEAFVWRFDSGFRPLGFLSEVPASPSSSVHDVSEGGRFVTGLSRDADGEMSAFRWSEESGMVSLGRLPGATSSRGLFISDDGGLIVGRSLGGPDPLFVWTPTRGMRRLSVILTSEFGIDLGGLALESIQGLSGDGRTILGESGQPWLATIPRDCPGDADFNGVTEVADITMVVKNLGSGAPNTWGNPGDANGDGVVTVQDVNYVVSNLGCVRE